MIDPKEIKKKNLKIFVGMPMYGGMLSEATMHGILDLQQWSLSAGVHMRFQTIGVQIKTLFVVYILENIFTLKRCQKY